jgi:hypothetical protein
MDTPAPCRIVKRDDREFEQVVLAELLVPDVPNSWGDIYSREAIKEFCYVFSQEGFGLDLDHDEVDVTGTGYIIVESFIARPGDPDFIEGSWVIGVKVIDPLIWQRIMVGDLNGFSFQADVFMQPLLITYDNDSWVVTGVTEPHPIDGHTHTYTVVIGPLNTVISGGTGITDNHAHPITGATITGIADGHLHRYQVIVED